MELGGQKALPKPKPQHIYPYPYPCPHACRLALPVPRVVVPTGPRKGALGPALTPPR